MMIDYDKYEDNSNILILLNNVVKQILLCSSDDLKDKLLFDLKLLDFFKRKLDSADYRLGQSQRKNIYPFINDLTVFLHDVS